MASSSTSSCSSPTWRSDTHVREGLSEPPHQQGELLKPLDQTLQAVVLAFVGGFRGLLNMAAGLLGQLRVVTELGQGLSDALFRHALILRDV